MLVMCMGLSCNLCTATASWMALRWESTTPLGMPVVPEV